MAKDRSRSSADSSSRKDRFKHFDDGYEFTLGDRIGYFAKIGIPIVLGVVVVVFVGVIAVRTLKHEFASDEADLAEEEDALLLIRKAISSAGAGNDLLAREQLRVVIRRYPTTTTRELAEEYLARLERGESLREMSNATDPSDWVYERRRNRPSGGIARNATSTEPGAEPPARNRPPEPRRASRASMKTALDKPSEIELSTSVTPLRLPVGFRPIAKSPLHVSGWPVRIRCDQDRSEMILIPAGGFRRGNDTGPENERPEHDVESSAFYIDRFEVTREKYEKFLSAYPDHPRPSDEALAAMASPIHPAVGVTYEDAEAYCIWTTKSLPTEAQWERAAKGSSNNPFPWGQDAGDGPKDRKLRVVESVRTFAADRSAFAVFGLGTNAAEWCSDWYADDAYATASAQDPTGPSRPSNDEWLRVIRGGSLEGTTTWRGKRPRDEPAPWLGFRGVLIVDTENATAAEAVSNSRRRSKRGSASTGTKPNRPSDDAPSRSRNTRKGGARRTANSVPGDDAPTRSRNKRVRDRRN